MKHRKSKSILALILAAAMAIPSNAATTMMNIGTVVADETESDDEFFIDDSDVSDLADMPVTETEAMLTNDDTNIIMESDVQEAEQSDLSDSTESSLIISDGNVISSDDSITGRVYDNTETEDITEEDDIEETEEKIDVSLELSFVDVEATEDFQNAFDESEALQANTIHIDAEGANYQDTLIDIYFWDYQCDGDLPDDVELWSDYIVSASDTVQFYKYQDSTGSVMLQTDDNRYLEMAYDEIWQDELHLSTSLSFVLAQNESISADFTVFSSENTMIEVIADDAEALFYAVIPIEKPDEQEDDWDDIFDETEISDECNLTDETLDYMIESEIDEESFDYDIEAVETDETETEENIEASETEYLEYDEDETDPDFEDEETDLDDDELFEIETEYSDDAEIEDDIDFETEEKDELFEIDKEISDTETEEFDSDFIETETEEDVIVETESEEDTEFEETEVVEEFEDFTYYENASSYIVLSMLNDNVHIDAYNADDEDAEVRLYFWNYDGELDANKETWGDFITGPYDISNGEDLDIADLPVTFSDGTVGSVHATYYFEDDTSRYIEFILPAESTIDVNLTFDIKENVIIEAEMGDQSDFLAFNSEDEFSDNIDDADEITDIDGDDNEEDFIDEALDDTDEFDAAISTVGYDIMPMSVTSSSGLWWFDDYYIGTSDLYNVTETDDFTLKYQIEFHTSEDLAENSVQITIPASIGKYRSGSNILPSDIGVPYGIPGSSSTTKSTPFNYYYADTSGNVISNTSSYTGTINIVFWNYKQIDSGTNVMVQVLYKNIDIMQVPDGTSWSNTPKISVNSETKSGYTLSGKVNTEVVLSSVTKTPYSESGSKYTPELYTQSQVERYIDNSLSSQYSGDNFDNYIYLVWKVVVKGTATQEWTLNIADKTFASSLQGSVVGYRYLGTSYGYRSYTNSVSSDGTEYTVGESTDRTINTAFYVVTAYDKSKYESLANGKYESVILDNTVTVVADPYDQIDPDITKTASANTTWSEYQWYYEGDNIGVYKWAYDAGGSSKVSTGSYSAYKELYDLNSKRGRKTSDFHYYGESISRGYSMTHVLPVSNSDGSVSMKSNTGEYIDGTYYQVITYDDILYVYPNGATQYGQALTKDDYYFDSITITVNDSGYDVWEDKSTTCETIDAVDQNIYIYAMFYDSKDWEFVDEVEWDASGKMTYTFSSSSISKEPYRIKVVHNGVGYMSVCDLNLYVTLRSNAPTIDDAIATYEQEVGGEVSYFNIENLDGLSVEQFKSNKSSGYVHDQGTDNGNYSEYDSKTGITLETFTKNLYGILLMRDNAYVQLKELEKHADSEKSVVLENDSVNERVLANYYITAYEGYYANSQSLVDQLAEAGLSLPDRNEVVFYDLLPYGMEFNASAGVSVGQLTTISGSSWSTNSRAWDSTDVSVTVDDEDVIPNWNRTGRTMIKFHIHYSGNDASSWSKLGSSSTTGMWFEGFGIYFQAYYDWSMINEADSQYNIAAYMIEDFDIDLLGAHDSEVFKDDGSYNGSSSYNPFKISDLNEDGVTDSYTNMYARAQTSTNVATAFTSGIGKKVRADADIVADYSNVAAVGLDQGYTYKISVTNFGAGTLSNIVVYDNLEYAVESGRTDEAEKGAGVFNGLTNDEIQNHWVGNFNGLSIDTLTDLGIGVIVYYSANRNAAISQDNVSTPSDVLTEKNGWYKAEDWSGDLSEVMAIAVDISHYTDGTEVELESGESLAFDIHMTAPAQYDEYKIYAFNNTSYYSVNTSATGETTSSTEASNTVRVELADVGKVEVIKYVSGDVPSQMSNAKFTFLLTRKDEILSNQEYLLYTWDGNDWIDSEVVNATDINGEFTLKDNQRAVFINLANFDDVNVEEIENVFWNNDKKTSSSNGTLSFTFTNAYRSPVYLYKTALTTDLATEEELEEAKFTFKIYVDKNGDGTYEVYSNGIYAYVSEVLTDGSSPEVLGYDYTDANGQVTIGLNDIVAFFPIDQDGNVIDIDYQIVETNIGDDWIVEDDTVNGTTSVYGKSSTITNYYKYRTLTITKELTYYDHDVDECKDEWTFKITDENGKAVTGNHWYMVDENGDPVLDEKGNEIEGYLDNNGEFTFSGAGDGRRVIIERLVAAKEYTVIETVYDDDRWEYMGDGVYTMPSYSINKNGTITNKYLLKDLSVSKLVLSKDSENSAINNVEFTFTLEKLVDNKYEIAKNIAYTIDGVEYKTDVNGQFVLKNIQTAVFDDIGYEHDEYRVTETANDTYWQIYPVENQPYESELGVLGDSVQFVNGDFEDVGSFTKTLEGYDDVGEAYTYIVKKDSQEKTLTYTDPTVAFAVYSADDGSLTFYAVYTEDEIPKEGTIYKDKTVTNVYTGFDSKEYTGTGSSTAPPWYLNRTNFSCVLFDKSFCSIQPIATAYWFYEFTNCSEIDGLKYLNTSQVTNMSYMFRSCSSLTTLDVSGFDTSQVTNMSYMFYSCSSLTTLDVSGFDTSQVTNMGNMFYSCSSLTTLDVSGFDTSQVTNMSYMFYSCSSLVTIYSNDANFVTTKVTSDSYMFSSCTELVGGNGTIYDASKITYEMAHVDTEEDPRYFTDVSEKPKPSNITQVSSTIPKTNSALVISDDAIDTEETQNDILSQSTISDFIQLSEKNETISSDVQEESFVEVYSAAAYGNDEQQISVPSMLSFTYDNDPTLSGIYSVQVTIGVYDSNDTLVTDKAGELTTFTYTSDYTFIYISQDGTVELYDYNGGLLDFTIYPYDYVYVAGLSNGKVLKVTESEEMSYIIYTTESGTAEEIGSDYILSVGKVMEGTAAANESVNLINVISTAHPYSEIYKLMTETSYDVSTGSDISFRVERYNESTNTWYPASGISYIILDGYTGDKSIEPNAISGLLETGSDGKIVLTKTDNGYPYIRFVDDEVYANVWTGMTDGQLRIVELTDGTDEDWGWLAGYDGVGWVNGSVLDVYYADTFIDANYTTTTTTEDDPSVQHFEVEKYMENNDGSTFTFQLNEITAVSKLPITSTSDILSSVVGANVFYVVYDTATGELISSGYTDSNGQFTLQAGQYAVFDVPDGTSWIVNEIIKTGYELTDSTANTDVVPDATIVDVVNGAYQVESSANLTHSIVLTLQDNNGSLLAGGTFDLYKDGMLVQSGLVTDSNGQIVVNLLGVGEYYFVQTATPSGYKMPDDANTETIIIDGTVARSKTYYVYVSNADSYNVKYAVTIYGIYQDVDKDGNKLGLTFGPATGKSYIKTYDAHLTKEEYESGENGICLHWMSWAEIIEQSENDATAFQSCLENGCTHSVELKLNDTLLRTDYSGEMDDGDGVGMLYYSINDEYRRWNGTSSSYTNEGGWPASKVRANLNGKDKYTDTDNDAVAGGDYTLDSDTALISCFPTVLQEAIVPKAVKSDTVYNKQTEEYNMTTYDKLWLLSGVEIYGSSESNNGVIRSLEGELYQRSEFLGITTSNYADLKLYYENGSSNVWWLRSVYTSSSAYVYFVHISGGWYSNCAYYTYGLAPSFCLK